MHISSPASAKGDRLGSASRARRPLPDRRSRWPKPLAGVTTPGGSLFPALENIASVSQRIALAVATEAGRLGLTDQGPLEELERRIEARWWHPHYVRLRRRRRERIAIRME